MCNPYAIAFGLSIAQQAYNYDAENKNAKYQEQVQKAQFALTKQAAVGNVTRQLTQLRLAEQERRDVAAQELSAITKQAKRVSGSVRASAADRGAAGGSIGSLLKDFELTERYSIAAALQESRYRTAALVMNEQSIFDTANNQIAGSTPMGVTHPSLLQPLLNVGAAGVGLYTDYLEADAE